MGALESLSADELASALRTYGDALKEHSPAINRLNVYPVPDGDTGTNMYLTVEAVMAEVDALEPGYDIVDLATCMSHGSLMGARGNSGVILSQVLRGMAGAFSEAEDGLDGARLAEALARASASAYAAVSNPVEGTILSVARAAAQGAQAAVAAGEGLAGVLEGARRAGSAALALTTEQLKALRSAGVVDAGGAGFLLLVESFLAVAAGRPIDAPPTAPEGPAGGPQMALGLRSGARGTGADGAEGSPAGPGHRASSAVGDDVGDLRYEVMFFLEAPDEALPAFRSVWGTCGASIVIVGGDGLYNCHIHTDNIGVAIEAAIEIGRPRHIRVTDLREQVEEERWVREAAASGHQEEPPPEPCTCAVVAVCSGDGVERIFRSLGARSTVAGGQSANPSTAEILEAIEAAPADQVVVLPNNPNVVAVAEQAAANSAKKVRVVPTAGIPEGFAALLEYDPEADVDVNSDNMTAAAQRVVAGEVAQASRQATTEAGPVGPGDWLGLSRQGVKVVAPAPSGPADAAVALLEALVTDEHEIVTIIEGEGSHASDTRRVVEWLSDTHPSVVAEVHHGGQPLYPYVFSIE